MLRDTGQLPALERTGPGAVIARVTVEEAESPTSS
jgi:hypothetical protein